MIFHNFWEFFSILFIYFGHAIVEIFLCWYGCICVPGIYGVDICCLRKWEKQIEKQILKVSAWKSNNRNRIWTGWMIRHISRWCVVCGNCKRNFTHLGSRYFMKYWNDNVRQNVRNGRFIMAFDWCIF